MGAAFLLLKGIIGGVLCLLATWICILAAHFWRIESWKAKHGVTGLGATAGGWNLLLQSPAVVVLLAVAFDIGFFAAIRLAYR